MRTGLPAARPFVFAECCVFNKQSQPPILCGLIRLHLYNFTY